jgi:intermediate peptidase
MYLLNDCICNTLLILLECRALQGSLAEKPTLVANFLEHLAEKLGQRAEKDFYRMSQMKGSIVQVWDPPFMTAEAKRTLLNVDRTDFMPYLSLGACMEGLNHLCQRLFNLELVPQEVLPGETWSPDVYKISGKFVYLIYLDICYEIMTGIN